MDFEVEGLQRRTSKKSWPSEPDTRSSHFGFIVYPIVFAEADSRKISLLKMLLGHPSQSPYHFGIESFHLKVFLLSIFTWDSQVGSIQGKGSRIFIWNFQIDSIHFSVFERCPKFWFFNSDSEESWFSWVRKSFAMFAFDLIRAFHRFELWLAGWLAFSNHFAGALSWLGCSL